MPNDTVSAAATGSPEFDGHHRTPSVDITEMIDSLARFAEGALLCTRGMDAVIRDNDGDHLAADGLIAVVSALADQVHTLRTAWRKEFV